MIIGIDPGNSGAIAAITQAGTLQSARDMPVVDKAVSGPLLIEALRAMTDGWSVDLVVIERVSSMPKQGVASTFAFGRGTGAVEGFAQMVFPGRLRFVTPQKWKGHHRLIKAEKKQAIDTASFVLSPEEWKQVCAFAAHRKHVLSKTPDGLTLEERIAVADAALIAAYGLDSLRV